ncbi:MAG: hypothetical protein IVW36_06285 [Dehalococcoidia bacterium]|nr:hypothetical protein [Dehalococcoidia bacterium]
MASKTVLRPKRTTRSRRRAVRHRGTAAEAASARPNLPHWKWRTFPVFAAFVAGLLLDSMVNPPASGLGTALRVIGLLGAGYVLAHMIVVNVIVAGRIRARDKALAAGEDPDVEWVDEVVHPDER